MTASVEYLVFAEFLLGCVASYREVQHVLQADELREMVAAVAVTPALCYNSL